MGERRGFRTTHHPPTDDDRVCGAHVADQEDAPGLREDLGLQARDMTFRVGQRHGVVIGPANRAAAAVEMRGDRLRQGAVIQ